LSFPINAFKCHSSSKPATQIPPARTWLTAIGSVKSTAQVAQNLAVFTVRATQYISGSGPSAEFEIVVRHSVHKKNLYERTKKAKLGSRVFLIGELDVHNNKLCIELHNFEFLSANPSPQLTPPLMPSSSTSSTSSSASEKRTVFVHNIRDFSYRQTSKTSNLIQSHWQEFEHMTSSTSFTMIIQTLQKKSKFKLIKLPIKLITKLPKLKINQKKWSVSNFLLYY